MSLDIHSLKSKVFVNKTNLDVCLSKIPSEPGLYLIYTNASLSTLRKTKKPKDDMHYDISRKIKNSDSLPKGFKISRSTGQLYIVYSGHAQSLRQRAREHFKGSKGSGCLAIFTHSSLRKCKWSFRFATTSELGFENDSKILRTSLEQKLRSKIGWPALCSQ